MRGVVDNTQQTNTMCYMFANSYQHTTNEDNTQQTNTMCYMFANSYPHHNHITQQRFSVVGVRTPADTGVCGCVWDRVCVCGGGGKGVYM